MLVEELVEQVWEEMSSVLLFIETDELCEALLFGYFPTLKLSSLFGMTYIQEGLPVNLIPFGPANLLRKNDLPPEKLFYLYLIIRERLPGGIKMTYCFPFEDWTEAFQVEVIEFEITDASSRTICMEGEVKVAAYAKQWFDSQNLKD